MPLLTQMQSADIPTADTLDRENWRRSNHSLAMLTYGQMMFFTGELQQNSHIMLEGITLMLTVVAPMYMQKKVLNEDKSVQIPRSRGIDTPKYKKIRDTIIRIRKLTNASLQLPQKDSYLVRQQAYALSYDIGMGVIQDANDMGFDFKPKLDPTEAYKG